MKIKKHISVNVFSKKSTTGFTFVELLVAIAIVGVLSAVVLANVRSAKLSASDKAIVASLQNLQVQAEYYYDNDGAKSYCLGGSANCLVGTNICTRNLFANSLIQSAYSAAQDSGWGGSSARCYSKSDAYAIAVSLKSGTGPIADGTAWCVDSTRVSRLLTKRSNLTSYSCPPN
jgi:prepilin-type N-terminal cleavage/methylation domain-containing protein